MPSSKWNPRRKRLRDAFTKSSRKYFILSNQSALDKATDNRLQYISEAQWRLQGSRDYFSTGEGDVHDCKNGGMDSLSTDIENDALSDTRHMSSEGQAGPKVRNEEERCMSGSSDSFNHDHSFDHDQDTRTQGVETGRTPIHDNYEDHSLTENWTECPHDQEGNCSSEGKGKAIDPSTLVGTHKHHLT
ncbi:hypothetical protein L486_02121 [Kwoniella mangroviensis CBS 10435]|uniref:Uncharacterized protein n=1 Tax=Kwoniella mangroviensis CBS 10435 TaxID=1331196 RepID=A0A1B9IV98_9TREE|nr:hypothetical protein L486_02121 [Kwoniella mangroviensis CBS 10435]